MVDFVFALKGSRPDLGGRPLVTALVNAYNYARYLPFAINSVLRQTYPHIEIIVVDDGSTDHTRDVLAQYGQDVQLVRTINGGQGNAFNAGLARANGTLTMLLDADDMWLPEKVERMVELAAQRPNAVLFYHRHQNVDETGKEIGRPQPFPLVDGNYRARYLRSGGTWWSPVTSVIAVRTNHVKRALPIPTYSVREGADTIVSDYCVLTGEIASVPDPLTLRLLHGSNLYASGRDDATYRTRDVREGDVRRIEWRLFTLGQIMARSGEKLNLDLDLNEWRMTNLYWLGRAPFWKMARASLLSPEHAIRWRLGRVLWALKSKRLYRGEV